MSEVMVVSPGPGCAQCGEPEFKHNGAKRMDRCDIFKPHAELKPEKYLILNVRDSRRCDELLWWRPEKCGYTTDIQAAGRYDELDAKAISYCEGGGDGRHDIAVPESAALALPFHRVVSRSFADELINTFPALRGRGAQR